MDVGRFDFRATVYAITTTVDGRGGRSSNYAEAFTRWASLTRMSGTLALQYAQLYKGETYEIGLRYDSTTKALLDEIIDKHEVKVDGRFFRIREVDNVDQADNFIRLVVTLIPNKTSI